MSNAEIGGFVIRLKMAIQKKGITASELSRLSGVGKSDISNYLKCKYAPKQDKCYMLAKALDVDPGWLMTGIYPEECNDTLVIEDFSQFGLMLNYMTKEEYDFVIKAFNNARDRMRKKGIDI